MAEKNQFREKNHNWRGGRTVASSGYMLVRVGRGHHLADSRGYAYEHRLVAEKKLGRRLLPGEQVHHVDHDKLNNAEGNLEVLPSRAHHGVKHRSKSTGKRLPGEPNPLIACACGCGAQLARFDTSKRPRRFVTGHNMPRAA